MSPFFSSVIVTGVIKVYETRIMIITVALQFISVLSPSPTAYPVLSLGIARAVGNVPK